MAPSKKSSRSATPQPSTPVSAPPPTSSVSKTNPFLKPPAKKVDVSLAATINTLWSSYVSETDKSLKMLDTLQVFLMFTGVAQFLYCVLVTNYPFNAFLGGFSATVGQFVLTASMRSQVNPENRDVFSTISPERAFGDFIFGSLILHFFVFNYLG